MRLDSTYKPGVPGNEDIDIAHAVVTDMIYSAILTIGNAGFRPGMPDYGLLLHLALAAQLKLKGDPWLNSGLIYLNGNRVLGNSIPFGASVPDVVYGPPGHPLAVFELKTGRAVDITDKAAQEQRSRTLRNMPEPLVYDYFLVSAR